MRDLVDKLKAYLQTNSIDFTDFNKVDLGEKISLLIKSELFDEDVSDRNEEKVGKNAKKAKDFVSLGDKLCTAKQYSSALKMYDKGILFSPLEEQTLYTVFLKRSQCLAKLKNIAAAANDLENALLHGCPREKKFMVYEKIVKSYSLLGCKQKVSMKVKLLLRTITHTLTLKHQQKLLLFPG